MLVVSVLSVSVLSAPSCSFLADLLSSALDARFRVSDIAGGCGIGGGDDIGDGEGRGGAGGGGDGEGGGGGAARRPAVHFYTSLGGKHAEEPTCLLDGESHFYGH